MIVQGLHEIQHTHGNLPAAELERLAQRVRMPLFRLQEVASFFPHFRLKPPPTVEIGICHDMACHTAGAARLKTDLERQLEPERAAGQAAVKFVSCLGRCDRAPAATVGDHVFCRAARASWPPPVARFSAAGRSPSEISMRRHPCRPIGLGKLILPRSPAVHGNQTVPGSL